MHSMEFPQLPQLTVEELEQLVAAVAGEVTGCDTEDREYEGLAQLWGDPSLFAIQTNSNADSHSNNNNCNSPSAEAGSWYSRAYSFWEQEANCPLSDDGVLGGYGKVTPADVRYKIIESDVTLLLHSSLFLPSRRQTIHRLSD